ncbi:unnamed protein product [Adineta steineri]|uniref:RING-type domain-containing protein n=1 Tax=Adineta steineri TaxID=433720 RepID=A0A815B9Y1_9BILA|nr:unnamed protein product [Adineta steineri]CAF1554647.1 unnamed protein product [Adineta steineri]
MATASKSTKNTYEYMDETKIDDELKCAICTQPFQKPVSLICKHTFCRQCIKTWLNKVHSCPSCRQSSIIDEDENLLPINTHIINNQLNRLLVRCNQCNESNIERGNFRDHESKCPKKIVSCRSVDIKCSWKGPRDKQNLHEKKCPFQQMRPIIDVLRNKLDTSLKIQNELHQILEDQSKQIDFLLSFINQGNTMHKECLKLYSRCSYATRPQSKDTIIYHCTICNNAIRRRYVTLHACSSNNHIDCICQSCYEKQYPILEDADDED